MSSAKLLKKDELNMSTEIKNGKLHTINIYILILVSFFILNLQNGFSNTALKKGEKWVIVIDPGHGGRDPGALGAISKEAVINLAISLKTGELLKSLGNVEVIYTRTGDTSVELIERPKIANRNNADLFISIHTNSAKSKSVMGAETYIMGLAKDEENLEVAMKENEVILLEDDHSTNYQNFDPKSPESYIIFSLMQNVFQKQSTELAAKIQNQFKERVNRNDRGVRQAGFWVLYNTSMPSVLIETGFITNLTEEKYLNTSAGHEYISSAIYRAIREYMSEIDQKSGVKIQVQPEKNTAPGPATNTNSTASSVISFKVQIVASTTRKELKPENFKGIDNIEEINSNERYRYTTGSFSEYADAVVFRKQIEKTFPDAFVIAVKDNKVLPLQEALEQKRKK